jgi:hypothetical protein
VETNAWLRTGTCDVATLSEPSRTSFPDLLSLSLHTESSELVTNNELEVFEISADEVYDEPAFPEAPELEPELESPLDEADCAVEAVAEPIDDDWGDQRQ